MSEVSLPYRDRQEAGRLLARHLDQYQGRDDVVVLALPRGGVPVAYEVAMALGVPLDVFTVRKLGVPGHSELAMGAIGTGGVRVLNQSVIDALGLDDEDISAVEQRERRELDRREHLYRRGRRPYYLTGRITILVDDGMATGSTMRAALQAVALFDPATVVMATPVAPRDTCEEMAQIADVVVCLATPEPFMGVGRWYQRFGQISDDEVERLLHAAAEATG